MKQSLLALIVLIFLSSPLLAAVEDHVGIIVKMKGDVKIFTNPGNDISGPPPHVLFEGKYYSIVTGKLGFKVENGNIVQTGSDSQIRIVYQNGDQYNVGPSTEYKVELVKAINEAGEQSVVNLMRGTFRAVISKKGPRNNMKVDTKTAAMGVRGTDFFIAKSGSLGKTKVSVLRGEVALQVKEILNTTSNKSEKKPETAEVKVKPGFSAEVISTAKQTVQKPSAVVLEKTNQGELAVIQKDSVITLSSEEKKKQEAVTNEQTKKEMANLEKTCVTSTLDDIKQYDEKLYEKLKKENIDNIAAINSQVVQQVFEKAPEAPRKPDWDELDTVKGDVYTKYFSIEED